ncbi:protein phosphatase 2C domain-containing protein [Fusibacter sp. 3D3]|uniref:protein phosphatase 2C domain-containing protein n=1 Tax=Fusibacter sp. 3D3 TaxID=1048380 RepID=UPI0008557E33|nr:protein phosphatase 2C domain-containing protein [Fusibacter sp. 3D3]GAU77966.1 hypothetical protein F3D3_2595 [Fusibacter sp. 3D3]
MKNWKVMSHSQIGSSHVKSEKPNQDAYLYKEVPNFIGAVSDGHGNRAHARSDIGSRFAVETAIESIDELLNGDAFKLFADAFFNTLTGDQPHEEAEKMETLKILISNWLPDKMVSNWRQKVLRHHEAQENSNAADSEASIYKLYGCTLLCAFEYNSYMIFMQVGDGLIGIYEQNGKVIHPIAEDIRHRDNVTTSISDLYAPLSFKTAVYPLNETIEFIALTTDGIENAYPNSVTDYVYFYHSIHGLIVEELPELERLLERTSRYSGDDSTALILYKPLQTELDLQKSDESSILYTSVSEDYVPIEHFLCDSTSSRFLEIAGELCYSFDQFETSGLCVMGLALQDIWYNPKENRMLLVSRILREVTPKTLYTSRKLLADLLYLILYKVKPVYKPQKCILKFDKAYAEVLQTEISHYSPRAWSLIIDQIRQETHYDYELGTFTFDGLHDETQLSIVTQLSRYEIFHDSTLYLHQILKSKKITNHKIANVVVHPKKPQIWGLQNCSNHEWVQYVKGSATPRYISRNKTATLIEGSVIFMYGIPVSILSNVDRKDAKEELSQK